LLRWVQASALGAVAGLLAATAFIPLIAVAVTLCMGLREPPAYVFTLTALLVATLVGGVIGVSQWRVLRIVVPGVKAWAWTCATLAASMLLWTFVFMPEIVAGGIFLPGSAPSSEALGPASLVAGICLGAVLGGVFGSVQWIALRRHAKHAFWWIVGSAGAGAIALPLGFLAATYAQTQTSYWNFWVAGVFSAAFIAALCACVTGAALPHLRPRFTGITA